MDGCDSFFLSGVDVEDVRDRDDNTGEGFVGAITVTGDFGVSGTTKEAFFFFELKVFGLEVFRGCIAAAELGQFCLASRFDPSIFVSVSTQKEGTATSTTDASSYLSRCRLSTHGDDNYVVATKIGGILGH